MPMPTLLDIAAHVNADVVPLINEAIKATPEISGWDYRSKRKIDNVGAAMEIPGLDYRTLILTELGNAAGSFRNANEGVSSHSHKFENRVVSTFDLHPRFECDKAVADRHPKGWQYYLSLMAGLTLQGEMQALSKQFYYGARATYANAKGFPGLLDSYDATNMVVDATGSTAATGSSVWLVKWGETDVQWVWGQDGSLDTSEVRIESLLDPNDNTKKFDGYVQTMQAYPGLQVASRLSIVRIKKLTADSGKGLTDDLVAQALMKFPTGIMPDAMFMSRRSLAQLQDSRTATNPTGAPAPFPVESHQVPILVTDGIVDTEALDL